MDRRKRLPMDHLDHAQQTPKEQWWSVNASRYEDQDQLLRRIEVLEDQINAYESRLVDFPICSDASSSSGLNRCWNRGELQADSSRPPASSTSRKRDISRVREWQGYPAGFVEMVSTAAQAFSLSGAVMLPRVG